MANIKVQIETKVSSGDPFWNDDPKFSTYETTAAAKAAIADKGTPGSRYRVSDVKWEGTVAPADSTIILKKA